MAELVFKDPYFVCGSAASPTTTLWTYVRSITLNYSADILDKTAAGDDFRSRIAGIKQWSMTVEFNQDYAASKVDATLFDYIGSTAKRINIRPTTSVTGAANPRFYGEALLESYPPIGGGVGDLATVGVTFQGDGILTRAVTS